LTDQEAMVFQTLRESGDALFKDLSKGTKLKRAELTHALDRLVALGFAKKMKRKGETVYREVDSGKD
jgi:DNA-binding MarR family transcriptional regulator